MQRLECLDRGLLQVARLVEVDEGATEAFGVGQAVVCVAMLFKQRLHAWCNLTLFVLGLQLEAWGYHRGEKMVFNLVVEVSHPPIAPPRRFQIDLEVS